MNINAVTAVKLVKTARFLLRTHAYNDQIVAEI